MKNLSGVLLTLTNLYVQIIGCLMLANAGFNIFILIKYPQYDDMQRKDAQAEISDYLVTVFDAEF